MNSLEAPTRHLYWNIGPLVSPYEQNSLWICERFLSPSHISHKLSSTGTVHSVIYMYSLQL